MERVVEAREVDAGEVVVALVGDVRRGAGVLEAQVVPRRPILRDGYGDGNAYGGVAALIPTGCSPRLRLCLSHRWWGRLRRVRAPAKVDADSGRAATPTRDLARGGTAEPAGLSTAANEPTAASSQL